MRLGMLLLAPGLTATRWPLAKAGTCPAFLLFCMSWLWMHAIPDQRVLQWQFWRGHGTSGSSLTLPSPIEDRGLIRDDTTRGALPILFVCFCVLGLHPRPMEVPRLGVASAAAVGLRQILVCSLHRSSQQQQILNPLSEAGDQT